MNPTKELFVDGGNLAFLTDEPALEEEQPDIVPFPEKVLVSCLTKSKGPLTKIMKLDPVTKELVKDGSECSMAAGTIHKIPISSPDCFARMLRSRQSNQALVHGVCEYDKARIVTKGKIKAYSSNADIPVIARSKDYITYPDCPGVMMFDLDKPRVLSIGSDVALLSYAPPELLDQLSVIHPAIGDAALVSTPSTSSCIYSATGEMLRGDGTGSHVYLFVKKAADIPRYLETVGKRLFLAGLGRIELSRSGAVLTRTLVDLSVGSPERPDFVAGAVCEDGLEQRLPEPTIKNGSLLDTGTLPSLTPEEEQAYTDIVAELIKQAKPNQEKVKAEYVEIESAKLVAAKNIPLDDARKIVTSRQDHVLEDDDILYFSQLKEGITVAEVLRDGATFHGKSLADPQEPEYENFSKTKAKFYWNDGNPIINSFAHGVTKYTFGRFEVAEDCSASLKWFSAALENASVSRFIDHEPPDLEWVFKGTLLARTTGLLVGPGAAGKSTLALLLLFAIATGRDILPGIFTPTKPGKALGVFGEDDEDILHHRIYAMARTLFGNDQEALVLLRENLLIVTTTGQDVRFISLASKDLEQSDFFTEVKTAVCKVENLRLIILDPVSRFHGAEENDNGAGTFLVSLMEQIAQTTGAAVIFLHHVAKRSGMTPNGFDLTAAMHQDASRGASGLTNGVRWQCNLSGLPEKDCKKLIGVIDARPGQYLAVKVSKKNYGLPEDVHFLERHTGGLMLPFDPPVKELDQDLEEKIKDLVLNIVFENEGRQLTRRLLVDGNCQAWKKENPNITRPAVEQTISACILRRELFEREGKNASGRKITYLSRYQEPNYIKEVNLRPETSLEPEIEPEVLEPENRREPEISSLQFNNYSESLTIVEPEILNRRIDDLRFVSARNCETVEPEIDTPYGGAYAPSGSTGAVPQLPAEDENAEYF